LIENGIDEMVLDWRADDMFKEEVEASIPGLWCTRLFGIDAILW
jgi:hypothetical protein